MELVMFLGNDFVASVCIEKKKVSQPGYMGKLKRCLIKENSHLLQLADVEPEFLVTNLPAKPANKAPDPLSGRPCT